MNFYISQRVQDQLNLILDLTNQVVSNLEFQRPAARRLRKRPARDGCDAAAIMLADDEG